MPTMIETRELYKAFGDCVVLEGIEPFRGCRDDLCAPGPKSEIEWYWSDESQGGRRKYLKITDKGKVTYDRNTRNWEYAKHMLDNLL